MDNCWWSLFIAQCAFIVQLAYIVERGVVERGTQCMNPSSDDNKRVWAWSRVKLSVAITQITHKVHRSKIKTFIATS